MATSRKYASFGIRLVALIIDAVVLGLASNFLTRAMPFLKRPLLGMLPSALYSILLWVNWNGQTVGKRAMGIKVVKEDGKPVNYQEAVLRYLGYIISSIPLGLGFFWVLADERKQGWHDKIARTLVVKE